LKRASVRCRGGELRPEYGSGEVDIRLVVSVLGLVLVVLQCAVMVIVPVGDGCLVEGGLLQGGVHPTEPGQRRNGLRDDKEQCKHVRGHSPQRSGIDEHVDMERPS
jgi:hypothetical protein